MLCQHTDWICLNSHGEGTVIKQTKKLQILVNSLPAPQTQKPSFALLLGLENERPPALYQDFSSSDPGTVHLSLDSATIANPNPLFIARLFPISIQPLNEPKLPACCKAANQKILAAPLNQVWNIILSRVLLPLADVICFICHHKRDTKHIKQILGQIRSSANAKLPAVLIVAIGKHRELDKTTTRFLDSFPFTYQLVRISKVEFTSVEGHSWLKNQIRQTVKLMLARKNNQHLHFSALHFSKFAEVFLENSGEEQPLDFITASRLANPIPSNLPNHLNTFINQVQLTKKSIIDFTAEIIASCFLLDHYHPEMHSKY